MTDVTDGIDSTQFKIADLTGAGDMLLKEILSRVTPRLQTDEER